MKFFSYIGISLLSTFAFASEKPAWVNRTPNDDALNFYFVGRGSSEKSESEAFEAARADAQSSAIRRLFGVTVKLDTRTLETTEQVTLLKQQAEVSASIILKGFTEVESFVAKSEAALLYKYPKSEFEAEKQRLSKLNESIEIAMVSIEEVGPSKKSQRLFKPQSARIKDLVLFQDRTPWAIHLLTFSYNSASVISGPGYWALGFGVERRIGQFGLKVSASYLVGKSASSSEVSGWSGEVGAPIYLNRVQTFYLEPDFGIIRYTLRSPSQSSVAQEFIGLGTGYQLLEVQSGHLAYVFDLRLSGRYLLSGTESGRFQAIVGGGIMIKF